MMGRKCQERNGSAQKDGSKENTRPQTHTQCEELRFQLLEKIHSGGFYPLKRLFLSHDPEGRGRVTRGSLLIILTTFLGRFINKSVFQRLLCRFHLEEKPIITFDAFYDHFKLEEDASPPEWLDPMKRKQKAAVKTAQEVHLQLKDLAKNRYFELLKLFPNDELKPSDLRSALTKMGIKMSEEEYKKLWSRYVKDETAALRFDDLQCHLGRIRPEKRGVLLCALQRGPDPREPPQTKTSEVTVSKTGKERKLSLSIEKWLKEKFREGARAMKSELSVYDPQGSGEVTKENFLQVLATFNLHLSRDQLGHFLSRCGLDETLPHVNYLGFLQNLQTRSQSGRGYSAPRHPDWGTRNGAAISSSSTTGRMQDQLLRFFHADFNSLLSEFRKADKNNLQVISKKDFREILERRFSIKVTDEELAYMMGTLPFNHLGDIRYLEFMAKFDSRDGNLSIWDGRDTVLTGCSRKAQVTNKSAGSRKSRAAERSEEQLTEIIRRLVKNNYETLEQNFNEMDERNTRRLTAETLYQLLKRCHVSPEISREDVQRVWKSLILNQDQTVDFLQLVRHFGFSINSSCFPNAKISPPVRGDVDYLVRSLKLNSDTKIIANFLQTKVKLLLDDLWVHFKELDPQNSGFVSKEEFLDKIQDLSPDLTKHQCDTIMAECSDGHNRISYVKFLQPYQTGRNINKQEKVMKTEGKTPSPKQPRDRALNAITAKLRQKISSAEWRNLLQSCQKMDQDGSGLLSLPEFRAVVRLCNIVLDEEEIYHIMSYCDRDLVGKIDYARLLKAQRKSK